MSTVNLPITANVNDWDWQEIALYGDADLVAGEIDTFIHTHPHLTLTPQSVATVALTVKGKPELIDLCLAIYQASK